MIILIIILSVLFTIITYFIISRFESQKIKRKISIKNTSLYNKLEKYIIVLSKKQLLKNKYNLTPFILMILMITFFIISFFIFRSFIRVTSTAIILSIPFFVLPILMIKILINREKREILKILPMYVVNLKNHVSEENNIIKAIQLTNVEEPLKKYIDEFKVNISRGMNVIEAFEALKDEIGIKVIESLINSCETCYLNGGDFAQLLEQYLNIITKENTRKEETREKAYSDILTLIVMVTLNVFVIIFFVFANEEYARIMQGTFLGRAILNLNALSYMLIGYLVSKMYKEE